MTENNNIRQQHLIQQTVTQTLQQKLSVIHLEILREAKMQTVQHSFVSRQLARQ